MSKILKKRKVFIAINFSEQIKKQIEDYKKEIQETIDEEYQGFLKWVKKDQTHITVYFLGYLVDKEIIKLENILQNLVLNYHKFDISFNKIVLGPTFKKPRIIWIEGQESEALSNFKKELDKKIIQVGIFLDKKDLKSFIPHITLSRIKTWQWNGIDIEERPSINRDINLKISINSIELMESKLKRTGPEYIEIKSFSLKD